MKKKWLASFLLVLMTVSLTACGSSTSAPQTGEAPMKAVSAQKGENMKAAVVYFSWSGNTGAVAKEIQKQTGADLFELAPQTPYSRDYDTVLEVAKRERQEKARPAIAGGVGDLGKYDVVFLGFPNWWSDMPMILYTFLESHSLAGKTIAPFCTSGGSGFSRTIEAIQAAQPDAKVLQGLHVGGSSAARAESAVAKWLGGVGLAR